MTAAAPARRVDGTDEVRAMREGDLDAAIDVLTRGFAEEPGNLALLPDPETRARVLRTGARLELARTMPLGSVHIATVDGVVGGVAVWRPPGSSSGSIGGLARALVHEAPALPSLLRPSSHKASVLLRHSPQAVPLVLARKRAVARASIGLTWHLAFLATAPEYRGRGLARRLLDRQLARCDEDGAAAWLETTDPVNPPIYERFGFATVAHVDQAAWLPGLWVMRRDATTDRTAAPGSSGRS
jgi:GNAT superfamily N-acetyltransferase